MADRTATVTRDTLETRITVSVNLDGSGANNLVIGIPFLEHMLDQIARHGLIDLDIKAEGDTHIDNHHTVEATANGEPTAGASLPRPSPSRSDTLLSSEFAVTTS